MIEKFFEETYLKLRGCRNDIDVGKCFHYGKHVTKDLNKARMYYLRAAKLGEVEAFLQLSLLSEEEGLKGESFFYQGKMYEKQGQWVEAKNAYERAVTENHIHSLFCIGHLYSKDRFSKDGQCVIKKNLTEELNWYQKAGIHNKYAMDALNSLSKTEPRASFVLAQVFQVNASIPKALEYYLIAARKGDQQALESLERLEREWDDEMRLQIAHVHNKIFNNKHLALGYYKYLVDKGSREAEIHTSEIIKTEYRYAYILGKMYEDEGKFQNALKYYLVSLKKQFKSTPMVEHEESLFAIERLNKHWNDSFQLKMGKLYRDRLGKKLAALRCFKDLADKKYQQASVEIDKTIKQDPHCAYILGKMYEEDEIKNINIALKYYLFASKCGHLESLAIIEKNKGLLDDDSRIELGKIYHQIKDNLKAIQCLKYLVDKNNSQGAIDELNKMFKENAEHAYTLASIYENEENIQKALAYYLIALKKHFNQSLAAIEKYKKNWDDSFILQMGQIYREQLRNEESAIKCFKYLADKGNKQALAEITNMAKQDASLAYRIARTYEEDNINNIQTAVKYYLISSKSGHQEALASLERFINQLDEPSRLELGKIYNQFNKDIQAIECFKYLVDKNNDKEALSELKKKFENKPELAHILGNLYEEEGNIQKALEYYLASLKKGFNKSLAKIESLELHWSESLRLQMGQIYRDQLGDRFNALLCFKYLANTNSQALIEISKTVQQDPHFAYILGKMYEDDEIKNLDRALEYYLFASKNGHKEALAAIERNNDQLDDTSKLELGRIYLKFGDKLKALQCFKYLVDKNNYQEEINELNSMFKEDPGSAYTLGNIYEDEGNIKTALKYYLVALKKQFNPSLSAMEKLKEYWEVSHFWQMGEIYRDQLNNKMAAFACFKYLADKNNDEKSKIEIEKLAKQDANWSYIIGKAYEEDERSNIQIALKFYLHACKGGNKEALISVERLIDQLDDASRFALGQIYLNLNNPLSALKCFKYLADHGNEPALIEIKNLIKKDAENAYLLGKLHEDKNDEQNLRTSYSYYILAAKANHSQAFNYLESLAYSGNAIAQFVLGCEYYHAKGQYERAIEWCMLASEQNYIPASEYLTNTPFNVDLYMKIAKKYEQGDTVNQDFCRARNFYEKAYTLGNKEAAVCLGHLYQIDHQDAKKDIARAFQCYLQAAKLGDLDALVPLERLGDEVSANDQLALSQVYVTFFNNRPKAIYWHNKATEIEQFESAAINAKRLKN